MLFLLGGLAISALPPLNGFVSEFLIYSGLLSGAAPTAEGDVVLVCRAAAVLAFVGAVGALVDDARLRRRVPRRRRATRRPRRRRRAALDGGADGGARVGILVLGLFPSCGARHHQAGRSRSSRSTPHRAIAGPRGRARVPSSWASRGLRSRTRRSRGRRCGAARADAREQRHLGLRLHGAATLACSTPAARSRRSSSTLFRPALPVATREQLPTDPFPQHASAPLDAPRRRGRATHVRGARTGRAVRARHLARGSRSSRGSRSPRASSRSSSSALVALGEVPDDAHSSRNILALLVMPILIIGAINRVKARWSGRGAAALAARVRPRAARAQDAGLQHGHDAGLPPRARGRPRHCSCVARCIVPLLGDRNRSSRSRSTSSGSRTSGASGASR